MGRREAKEAAKSKLFVERTGDNLMITDSVVVFRGPEVTLWEVVKALPAPLPSGRQECFRYMDSKGPEACRSLLPTIQGAVTDARRDLEDTNLTTYSEDSPIRLLAPCSREGEYTAIQEKFFALFDSSVVMRQGEKNTSPIACIDRRSNDWVGCIMPLYKFERSPYLAKLAAPANETAAD